jgi:hypothetical protein
VLDVHSTLRARRIAAKTKTEDLIILVYVVYLIIYDSVILVYVVYLVIYDSG